MLKTIRSRLIEASIDMINCFCIMAASALLVLRYNYGPRKSPSMFPGWCGRWACHRWVLGRSSDAVPSWRAVPYADVDMWYAMGRVRWCWQSRAITERWTLAFWKGNQSFILLCLELNFVAYSTLYGRWFYVRSPLGECRNLYELLLTETSLLFASKKRNT